MNGPLTLEGGGGNGSKKSYRTFSRAFFAGVIFILPIDLLLKCLSLDFTALTIEMSFCILNNKYIV